MPKFTVTYTVVRDQVYTFTVSAVDSDTASEKAQHKIDEALATSRYAGIMESEDIDITEIEVEEE